MLRREVIRMASGLFGLGTGTPSRFPYPDRPQGAPGIGAGNGQIIRAREVIIFGKLGLFVYNGNPAFGNLIQTITATAGTDPYGNAYIGGDVTYANLGGSGYAAMQYSATGMIRYTAPTGAGGPYGLDSSILLDATGAHVNAFATIIQGSVTAIGGTPASPTVITTDGWNTLAPINGWANVAGEPLKYTLLPARMVMVAGVITSAGAAGNPIFANLPAGPPSYRPATQQETAAGLHGAAPAGGAFMRVAVNGDMSIPGSTVGTGPWSVSWTFSLDYA